MLKDQYQFPCPCCGKQLELDATTGKVRAIQTDGKRDLDDLLAAQERDSSRMQDAFDAARKKQAKESDYLDRVLDDAKKRARENPDEKLRRPFDLD
jgi:uncharacterized Zn finger protein (UPF0148 family)